MNAWNVTFQLDPAGKDPLFLQVAAAIRADIQRGRLRPGAKLPGSRTLARTFSVHRNTVVAAYEGLVAEGWIEASEARGTFVSRALPVAVPRAFAGRRAQRAQVPDQPGFDLAPAPVPVDLARTPAGAIGLGVGVPDPHLLPVAALTRAYRRVLRHQPRSILSYGDPQGHPRLRSALAAMLTATRGLATGPEEVVVTQGSQMALDLIARTLVRPGDVVAVESFSYPPACETLRQHGAQVVPIPVDQDGMVVEALEEAARRTRFRAAYVTPHHQFPTMVTMAAGRRLALLDLARRTRMAVIEDDYDHEFHYEGRPVLPLASVDRTGVVIYVGSLAKILAPGLRLGYVAGPRALLERIAAHRSLVDRHGNQAVECAVAELLEDGEVQRHVRRARRVYRQRRDFMVAALRRELAGGLTFGVPPGGMALWVEVTGVEVEAWTRCAFRRGVHFHAGSRYALDGKAHPFARLGYSSLPEEELAEGVRRLVAAFDDASRRSGEPTPST
jgi:GntR family transcriptional regulator / MocR family aminotransferase